MFDVVSARDFGAVGDGIADDAAALQAAAEACFGPVDAPKDPATYKPLFIPAGVYTNSAPIRLRSLSGAWIFGAGRMATRIVNTAGTPVFITNGCQYSRFENMRLDEPSKTAPIFELDWDRTGYAALQSNTFANMHFFQGSVGLRIGASENMGSENLILNCYFAEAGESGIATMCFNALQNSMVGGNIRGCPIGIDVQYGAFSNISGVGFQNGDNIADVFAKGGAHTTFAVIGSRSESRNFVKTLYQTVSLIGCSQNHWEFPGEFLHTGFPFTIDNCCTVNHKVVANYYGGDIRASQFGRDDWIEIGFGARVNLSMVMVGRTFYDTGFGAKSTLMRRGYVEGASVEYFPT